MRAATTNRVLFILVTDRPEEALADALCCAMSDKPHWVHLTSDPLEILDIPNGTKCHGLWYSSRARMSPAEQAWRERRLYGGLDCLSDDDHARISAWIEKHKARIRAQLDAAAARIVEAANSAPVDEPKSVLPHPQPEIQNLVLSQRWT